MRTVLANATIIPLDGTRRIIERGHVLVEGDRIAAIGETAWPDDARRLTRGPHPEEPRSGVSKDAPDVAGASWRILRDAVPDGTAPQDEGSRSGTVRGAARESTETIDLDGAILIPGLIDLHLHAGHGLTKNLGGTAGSWMEVVGSVYALHSDVEFWAADAALQALERLRGGTTLGVPFFGGGDNVMRSDDPAFAEAHLSEVAASGLREVLVMGLDRPPFPKPRRAWDGGSPTDGVVTAARQFAVIETVAARWRGGADGRLAIGVSAPVVAEAAFAAAPPASRAAIEEVARGAFELSRHLGARFVQDGHRDGSIGFMAERFGLFDETSVLAHSIDLTEADFAALRRTGAAVAYTPSSLMAAFGHCPVPRLMAEGVTIGLGTDGPAPDRPLDMFRTLFMAHRNQAIHLRDDTKLDAWSILEMATRGGARALGLGHELGSIAVGLKADLVAVSRRGVHLWPPDRPVERLVFFANASDVALVMVDGRLLLRDTSVLTLDEGAILARADAAYRLMKRRAGLP